MTKTSSRINTFISALVCSFSQKRSTLASRTVIVTKRSRLDCLTLVADYNREKDRVTIEETFRRLIELMDELDAEQRRAVEEGLNEDELALFDLLNKDDLGQLRVGHE